MRINRYNKFVESASTDRLNELVDGVVGFEKDVEVSEDGLQATFRVGSQFEITDLQDLFEQIAEIEGEFPDVTWTEDGGDFIFEFYQ